MKSKSKTAGFTKQPVYLLNDLYRDKKYKTVRQEFKKLLLQIKEYMSNHSPVVQIKHSKLDRYTTTICNWETETSTVVEEKINGWKRGASKNNFMVYKNAQGWNIIGLNIAGKFINQPIKLIEEHDAELREALKQNLQLRNDQGIIKQSDPLHLIVTDYFGFYRPAIFFSYSWPSPEFPTTLPQDSYNKTAIHKMAKDFGYAGFRVLIDKDDLSPALKIDRFFNLISDEVTDYICVMATPLYKKKYDSRSTSLGNEDNKTAVEADTIIHHATSKRDFNDRVFTLLLEGEAAESIPALLSDKIFSKFTTNDYFNTLLRLIVDAMYKLNSKKNKDIKRMIATFDEKIRPTNLTKFIEPLKENPVVIFTDPGVDDFAALALALSPKALDIKAIVACSGNLPLDLTLQNVLDICHLAQRSDIPVLRGSDTTISGQQIKSDFEAHGDNGLNNVKLETAQHSFETHDTTDFIIESLQLSPEPITLISLAGLTDIAKVLTAAKEKNLLDKIAGISMMGGVFNPAEANAPKRNQKFPQKYGEFNFLCDPDATQLVFEICRSRGIPIPVILFELSFTHHFCRYTSAQTQILRQNPLNLLSNTIAQTLDIIPDVYKARFPDGPPSQPVHDVFPVMALIESSLFEGESVHIRCQSSSDSHPGKCDIVNDPHYPKVFLVKSIPANKQSLFYEKYAAMLSQYPSQSKNSVPKNTSLQSAASAPSSAYSGTASARFFQPDSESKSSPNSNNVAAVSPRATGVPPESPIEAAPASIKRTQAIASVPRDINPNTFRDLLDVGKDFQPPKFQTKTKPADRVEEDAVVFIVQKDSSDATSSMSNSNK